MSEREEMKPNDEPNWKESFFKVMFNISFGMFPYEITNSFILLGQFQRRRLPVQVHPEV